MSSTGFLVNTQRFIIKNAPTILSVMGAVGCIAAVVMSSEAAITVKADLIKAEMDKKGDKYPDHIAAKTMLESGKSVDDICNALAIKTKPDISDEQQVIELASSSLTQTDKAIIYAKAYAPTALMTGASIFCIFGSNHLSKVRIAALASAYIASENNLKEYKDKVLEVAGKKKAQEVKDELIQDKIDKNPATAANTIIPTITNTVDLSLWYDVISDRYFYSNADYIRRAEIEGQAMLNQNGFVSLNDIYNLLGIKEIPLGDDIGWEFEKTDSVTLTIGAALDDKQQPVGTLNMEVMPSNAWLGAV